jgi:hypothetical protein
MHATPALMARDEFGAGFTDAGEHHVGRAGARRQYTLQFATRDDVETGAEMFQDAQDGQVVVGLHRVVNTVATRAESAIVGAPVGFELLTRIDVAGRAERRHDAPQVHPVDMQNSVAIATHTHQAPLVIRSQ